MPETFIKAGGILPTHMTRSISTVGQELSIGIIIIPPPCKALKLGWQRSMNSAFLSVGTAHFARDRTLSLSLEKFGESTFQLCPK